MSITITPSLVTTARKLDSKTTITPSLVATARKLDSKAVITPSIVATIADMDKEGDCECHYDILRTSLAHKWRYDTPAWLSY